MWILIVEAGFAFLILAFIVWWTMFSGRPPEGVHRQAADEADTGDTSAKAGGMAQDDETAAAGKTRAPHRTSLPD
jgi:hypothetical protein